MKRSLDKIYQDIRVNPDIINDIKDTTMDMEILAIDSANWLGIVQRPCMMSILHTWVRKQEDHRSNSIEHIKFLLERGMRLAMKMHTNTSSNYFYDMDIKDYKVVSRARDMFREMQLCYEEDRRLYFLKVVPFTGK